MLSPRKSQGPLSSTLNPVWNRKRASLWMIGAWREGRRPTYQGALSTVRSALDWPALFLPVTDPAHSEAQDLLMLFLWSQAEGASFRDVCARRGKSRSTAMRKVNWALDRIVAGLNEDHARAAD